MPSRSATCRTRCIASSKSPTIWIVERPMIQRLRQLSVSDLAGPDEDDRAETEIRRRAINRQSRRGVARACTGNPPSRNHACMRECRGHSIVFEAAGGIHAFVLEPEGAGFEADVAADLVRPLEQSLAFADGDDLIGRQRTEAARGTARRPRRPAGRAACPFRLEICQPARARAACPTGRPRRAGRRTPGRRNGLHRRRTWRSRRG